MRSIIILRLVLILLARENSKLSAEIGFTQFGSIYELICIFEKGYCIGFKFKWINPNSKTQAEAGNDNGPARSAQLRTVLARELPGDLTGGTRMSARF